MTIIYKEQKGGSSLQAGFFPTIAQHVLLDGVG
jgi:hypothetical protein